MNLRNLGKSGLRVSMVGLGCNNFGARIDLEATRRVVDHALDLGITLFDTADIYGNKGGSETLLGEVLGGRRSRIVLATKFGMQMEEPEKRGGSRRYIMFEIEDSLRRLKTDWIDLYQLHQPDPLTPIAETLRALDDLVRQGKVRYIGCSNLPAWQVVEAQWTSRDLGLNRFISCQDEYSLLARQIDRELVPAIQAYGLGLLPFFPLASGALTGKYRPNEPMPAGARLTSNTAQAEKYLTGNSRAKLDRLSEFSAERGHSLLELAFSWLLARPGVASVIAGATKPEQLDQNISAVNWSLTLEELAEVDRITQG
jgi:aryl-alcohol dehydrogenase-like predicted oxidoreductase